MKRKLLAVAAGLGMLASLPASAALIIDTSGPNAVAGQIGDFGTIEDNNALISSPEYGPGTILDGWFGANLKVDDTTALKFTFLGKEAYYKNSVLSVDGNIIFNTDPTGTSFTVGGILAGFVNFVFNVDKIPGNGVDEVHLSVANGANNSEAVSGLADFWLGYDPKHANSVLVALDDGGANPVEDNHDDMLIRITEVPEPASVALLGLGVLGLGMARRKKA